MKTQLNEALSPENLKLAKEEFKRKIAIRQKNIEAEASKLSKNSMLRVFKMLSGFALANEVLGKDKIELKEQEAALVTMAFNLQEDAIGLSQLTEELSSNDSEEEQDVEEA